MSRLRGGGFTGKEGGTQQQLIDPRKRPNAFSPETPQIERKSTAKPRKMGAESNIEGGDTRGQTGGKTCNSTQVLGSVRSKK